MSDFAQVLFQGGRATPLMLARWRAKGGLKPLSDRLQLTIAGIATGEFRSAWREGFPTRTPLPNEPLHDEQGRMTIALHRVWR